MKIIDVSLDEISTELCVREHLNDVKTLVRSIGATGLLHPIGVTEDLRLVYGRRRLEACRCLKWQTIPAVVVENERHSFSIMRTENAMREDLTPEEQVLLAQRVEEEIRINQPALLRELGMVVDESEESGECGSVGQVCQNSVKPVHEDNKESKDKNEPSGQVWQNFAKPDRKNSNVKRVDDIAAKAAGLGNRGNYRKAEAVVNHGSQPLKDAMNQNKVSIDAAYQLSKLPEDEQAAIDYDDKPALKEKVRQIRKPPREPAMKNLKPEIACILELTRDWPEEQLMALIEMLKKKVEGNSEGEQ